MRRSMFCLLILVIALMVGQLVVHGQTLMGSAFTYQGQLKQAGAPVNDTCDFQLSLWDSPSGGNQVGTTQTVNNVAVTNGLFTVELDFGGSAFSGDARWLQTAVRCPAGSGGYTNLSPRQELTPVPYALYAQQSAAGGNTLDQAYDQGGSGVGRTITADSGAVRIAGPDGLTVDGKVGLGTTSPVYKLDIEGGANPLQITGGGRSYHKFRFNVETDGFSVFRIFDNNRDEDFRFATNGDSWLDGPGNVGIGTKNPTERLDVAGTVQMTGFQLTTSPQAGYVLTSNSSGIGTWQPASGGLTLPYHDFWTGQGTAFSIRNSGIGHAGYFRVDNKNNNNPALRAETNSDGDAFQTISDGQGSAVLALARGTGNGLTVYASNGRACYLQNRPVGGTPTLVAGNRGGGSAAHFNVSSSTNPNPTLLACTSGTGRAGQFIVWRSSNFHPALEATTYGSGRAVHGMNRGSGQAAYFGIMQATNTSTALSVRTNGTGYAGYFSGGTGVRIVGKLSVTGSKNAVVKTSQGPRGLYCEEATEVWFTDYGFGRLRDGKATIEFDCLFAETVNLDEPYHVFVQPYGKAELYVSKRSPTAFRVSLMEGEPNVEFSYRVVAKRRGYEEHRLEFIPEAKEILTPDLERQAKAEVQDQAPGDDTLEG